MKRFLLLSCILLLAGGLLASCDTPPHREPFPQLTYQHLAPINLDVAQIVIQDTYQPPMTDPHMSIRIFPPRRPRPPGNGPRIG